MEVGKCFDEFLCSYFFMFEIFKSFSILFETNNQDIYYKINLPLNSPTCISAFGNKMVLVTYLQ